MYFAALASDYDNTLAREGAVDAATISALERVVQSGRRLVLATGRRLGELRDIFPRLDLFDRVVAENGALLYWPATGMEEVLAAPPPAAFVARLAAQGVAPLAVGRVIVASTVPHDVAMREAIDALGLRLDLIRNVESVMALPTGVTKATGVAAALAALDLPARRVVAVGDAENDREFLQGCGFGVAVANAVPMLKETADWVTSRPRGAGVAELADRLVATDLADVRRAR